MSVSVAVTTGKPGARAWCGPGVHRTQDDPARPVDEAARPTRLGQHGIPCPTVASTDGPGHELRARELHGQDDVERGPGLGRGATQAVRHRRVASRSSGQRPRALDAAGVEVAVVVTAPSDRPRCPASWRIGVRRSVGAAPAEQPVAVPTLGP